MADRLVAWLYDTPVAVLIRGPEFRIRLEWRPEGIERWGLGSPVLSVGLPIGAPTGPRDMRGLDFFENMLPEGPALERMAVLAGVRPVDTYGILAAFGHDCAGAIMVLPDGERPGGNGDNGYSPMTSGDLLRVISALDVAPLGAAPERGFRPSLAGFQRKALLGRAGDGTWQRPYGDAPSTWILKPDGPHPMAANEATCLRLGRRLRSAGARGGTARRRRPARPGGQALRPAGRTCRGHPGPGAPGRRLPGHRHASRAEIRGTRRPGAARPRRGHQELRRSPRRHQPAAPHDVQPGRRQRGRARQELLRPARARHPGHRPRPPV